jgi:hypothetical protein
MSRRTIIGVAIVVSAAAPHAQQGEHYRGTERLLDRLLEHLPLQP